MITPVENFFLVAQKPHAVHRSIRAAKFIFCFCFCIFLNAPYSNGQDSNMITIQGEIKGNNEGFNRVLCHDGSAVNAWQEIEMKDGKFEFSIPFEKPVFPRLYTSFELEKRIAGQPYGVLIDKPGTVNVLVENIQEGFVSAKISGIETAVLYQSFKDQEKEILRELSSLNEKKIEQSSTTHREPIDSETSAMRDSFMATKYKPFISKWIMENHTSYAAVFVLYEYSDKIDLKDVVHSFHALDSNLRQSEHGILVSKFIEAAKKSDVGMKAANFVLNTNEGKPFNLYQARGKYLVIDFWASWCRPCREAFPHMREIYTKVKPKNVEFITISIDKNKEAWMEAARQQDNPWIELWDNQDIGSNLFGVGTIPAIFLLDPSGKIISKQIGFEPTETSQIEKKMMELRLLD